jgi:MFS family permease
MKQFFKKSSEFLSLNRNVAVLGGSLFGLGLGEELWLAYLPLYLTALGASGFAVGLVYSFRDFLDGIYQYPGGWVNDRFGRKRALMLFTLIAMGGYVVIAEALPAGKRGIAFSVQSILVRVPRVIAAPLGGLIIGGIGVGLLGVLVYIVTSGKNTVYT